ncbi:MAG: two-component system sensor histidine kinase RppB [Thermosynechococcaceae cyanobacterium]
MNTYSLFWQSRLRLALWYAGVMGIILGLSGLGIYRAMVQSNWDAMEREIESIAGTLHDSVEPLLPAGKVPTATLQQIFPDLCLTGQPCQLTPTLIQRHTLGISDRSHYYIRLFDHQGHLLAFSPNQPIQPPNRINSATWQTLDTRANRTRYRQFTTTLHSATLHSATSATATDQRQDQRQAGTQASWGYLQIGRTLATLDAETHRIQWVLIIGFSMALVLVTVSSWWLSGLAMRPIYQSYQRQQQFTADAAHELRSPLASLLATVEATLRLPPSQQTDIPNRLQTVERQGRRLSQLIADLLLLTSLEQSSLKKQAKSSQPCCLNDLVNDLTEEFSELAIASSIHLTGQAPQGEIYVSGNESQLYRLVSNLIANAIGYTPAGGNVSITLTADDHTALIAVKDTGIGITSHELARIFDRFYRIESDRSRKTGGTGLGLAIADAIAQTHRGKIQVHSQLDQGSSFIIYLPTTID